MTDRVCGVMMVTYTALGRENGRWPRLKSEWKMTRDCGGKGRYQKLGSELKMTAVKVVIGDKFGK